MPKNIHQKNALIENIGSDRTHCGTACSAHKVIGRKRNVMAYLTQSHISALTNLLLIGFFLCKCLEFLPLLLAIHLMASLYYKATQIHYGSIIN